MIARIRKDGNIVVSSPGVPDFIVSAQLIRFVNTKLDVSPLCRYIIDSGVSCRFCVERIVEAVLDCLVRDSPSSVSYAFARALQKRGPYDKL
jgi:hypothetical protein